MHSALSATSNNPLIGDGVHPVIYYYDYSDDGTTGPQIVNDRTNNTTDTTALRLPDQFYIDNGLIVQTSPGSGMYVTAGDDLFTTLIDGNSQGSGVGGAPTLDFVYDTPSDSFLLPGARALDIETRTEGAFTGSQDILGNAQLAGAGGYTFETYIKRTSADITRPQIVWSPEGTHSIEIIPHDDNGDSVPDRSVLQVAIRQQGRFLADVDTILPIGEWRHIMAVLDITASPNANYSFYVDGELIVPDVIDPATNPPAIGSNPIGGETGVPINGGGLITLDSSNNHEHGLGTQEHGSPPGDPRHLLGQLAMTRLSLGVLTLQQSLFDIPTAVENANFDGSGFVDGADFLTWQRGFGKPSGAALLDGDANASGTVNGDDFAIWKAQFGNVGLAAPAISTIPEPATEWLMTCGALGYGCFRKHRSKGVPHTAP